MKMTTQDELLISKVTLCLGELNLALCDADMDGWLIGIEVLPLNSIELAQPIPYVHITSISRKLQA